MVCVYCGGKTAVKNSRGSAARQTTWRRRECLTCRSLVTTREQIDYGSAWRVKSSSSQPLRPFLRDKLFLSVYESVSHRKTALEDATQLTDTIIPLLGSLQHTGIIPVSGIIRTTTTVLGHFDKAAGVHYQAHHSL